MTQKERDAYVILAKALTQISARDCGGLWNAPKIARKALKDASTALVGGVAGVYSLETDSDETSGDFLTAKRFVETFVKSDADVKLEVVTDYVNARNEYIALYQLDVAKCGKENEMYEWLEANDAESFTTNGDCVSLYFEIKLTADGVSAFLITK